MNAWFGPKSPNLMPANITTYTVYTIKHINHIQVMYLMVLYMYLFILPYRSTYLAWIIIS